jgi:hypothetical protein
MNQVALRTETGVVALSAIDRQAIEQVLPAHRKFIEAGLTRKIVDQQPITAVETIKAIITTAYTIAGQQVPDGATLALYTDELFTKIIDTFKGITLDEVRAALRNGVYGEYGEYFGLNPRTFVKFIEAYLKSDERSFARELFAEKQLLLSEFRPTPEQTAQSNREFINLLYEDFLAGTLITDFIPAFLFHFLENSGTLVLSNQAKNQVKASAMAYHARMISASQTAVGLLNLSGSFLMGSENADITIKNISKQFAVNDFFQRCKLEGKETIFEVPKQIGNDQ